MLLMWSVQEVVWPALGSDPQGLVYQGMPTFRCHLPGTGRPLIRKHNDVRKSTQLSYSATVHFNFIVRSMHVQMCCLYILLNSSGIVACVPLTEDCCVVFALQAEYFHQTNEINVWLPVTRTFSSNTLWSEYTPGKGDFHPFECEGGHKTKGQCVLFVSLDHFCLHWFRHRSQ